MFFNAQPFLQPDLVNKIEVELTNRCNAACPSCSRTDVDGKPIRSLTLTDISLPEFKRILPPHWIKEREIKLCGVFGDPMVAKDSLEISRYVDEAGGRLTINTNGGMHSAEFWKTLGAIVHVNSGHHGVIFSIDGLKDTNSIYRRNTSWDKIIANARAFIAAGGLARWDFLVFSHNEHQVDEAQSLAKEMGFKRFTIKKTTRASDEKKPTAIEQSLGIAPSRLKEFQHPSLQTKTAPSDAESGGTGILSSFFQTKERQVECFARGESRFQKSKDYSLYISANLRLWPCCWYADAEFPQKREVRRLFQTYGKEFNDLKAHRIEDVLKNQWFNKELVKSWYNKKSPNMICEMNCNKFKPLNNEDCKDTNYV